MLPPTQTGQAIGPLIAASVPQQTGIALINCFAFVAVVAACSVPESLHAAHRLPFQFCSDDVNPLKQIWRLCRCAVLRRMALCYFLMSLPSDGLMSTFGLFMRGSLQLTKAQFAVWVVLQVLD